MKSIDIFMIKDLKLCKYAEVLGLFKEIRCHWKYESESIIKRSVPYIHDCTEIHCPMDSGTDGKRDMICYSYRLGPETLKEPCDISSDLPKYKTRRDVDRYD